MTRYLNTYAALRRWVTNLPWPRIEYRGTW
jgi:hypothetical protein